MNILYAAAEVAPYSKVGGLADVAASLPKALRALGHDVRVIAPAHELVKGEPAGIAKLPALGTEELVSYRQVEDHVYLVVNETYFKDRRVYGETDDLLRYHLFTLAVLEAPVVLGWKPDVINCSDWHTGWLPLGLRNYAWNDQRYRGIASALTIHNLAYRGPDALSDVLGPAIYYADVVNTVSPTYAREITTPDGGFGLERLLRLREERLYGILNGIDPELYDPAQDPALAATYTAATVERRAQNKAALQRGLGLAEEPCTPLVVMVSRLDQQKGLDLVLDVIDEAVPEMQLAFLGNGTPEYAEGLRAAAARHPGRVGVELGFRADLSPLFYGGSDLFLMPSRFEPCGLGQLIAMRYGSVPVVRRTGGLADTVVEVSPDLGYGTGFVFEAYDPGALLDALRRAASSYREEAPAPAGSWRRLVQRAMGQDFSWGASAREYEKMYLKALEHMTIHGGIHA